VISFVTCVRKERPGITVCLVQGNHHRSVVSTLVLPARLDEAGPLPWVSSLVKERDGVKELKEIKSLGSVSWPDHSAMTIL
jgi:hypothetical protein